MPNLLNLHTDLKSIKYGKDTPGGGNSGQPYIQVDINNPTAFRLNRFDDGNIRGGIIGATMASTIDTVRIGKFLKDTPKGPLFIAKQIGLQLSNPKLESKKLKSINLGGGLLNNIGNFIINTANNIENAVGPTRIYNLGINTLAQIPVNAFGGHIVRHGFLPIQDSTKYYENVVYENNINGNNRLVGLVNRFKLGDNKPDKILNSGLINKVSKILGIASNILGIPVPNINIQPQNNFIDEYIGGPSSVYGIGKTLIKRYNNTEDKYKIDLAKKDSNNFAGKTRDKNNNGPKEIDPLNDIGTGNKSISNHPEVFDLLPDDLLPTSNNIQYNNYKTLINNIKQQQNLKNKLVQITISGSTTNLYANQYGIYNTIHNGSTVINNNSGSGYSNVDVNKIVYKNSYDELVVINKSSWNNISREVRVGSGRKDLINLTPLFNDNIGSIIDKKGKFNINDLVKFRIQSIDNDNPGKAVWMIFRAYLTDLSDSVGSKWNEINYNGRGDTFFVYNGFSRKINVSFKVAALSYGEMEPMYQKLNYLMGNLMPDYKDDLMRGPFVRMTIGNYIDGQLAKLDDLTYKISNDTPWEIAINDTELILPHIIEVNLSFTPIGSQTKDINKISGKDSETSHIAQNWNKDGVDYIKSNTIQ